MPLIAIAGPTASGKTQFSLQLAHALDGEIICADSRQIYKDMDIGTAKPTANELAQAPHHLFDCIDPRETYSVANYRSAAQAHITDIEARQKQPLLVGGTGLYFRTLLYNYGLPEVPAQPELRAILEQQPLEELKAELLRVDPVAGERIHLNDRFRLVRALEVYKTTGKPISSFQTRSRGLSVPCVYVGLRLPKPYLYARIQQRIELMFEQGLIAEVQRIQEKYGKDLPLLKTLNYAEVVAHLAGEYTLAETKEKMFISTRQYARRQRTWFQRDAEIHWFDITGPADIQDAVQWVLETTQNHV